MAIPLSNGDLRLSSLRSRGLAGAERCAKFRPLKQLSRNIGFHHRHRGRYSHMQFCVIIFFEDRACVPRQILLDRDCFLNRLSAISEMQATSIRAALKNTQAKDKGKK